MAHTSPQEQTEPLHIPVLLEPVLQYLQPQAGESYLDLTAGYGGHASKILDITQKPDRAVLVDRDSNAIRELQQRFVTIGNPQQPQVDIRRTDFLTASRELLQEGRRFDMILADLGVSSPHLNQESRGFSIVAEGPLDMRMDQSQELTAADIVNGYTVEQIADILKRYGEEPKAFDIARKIADARKATAITTTTQLATIVARAWPGHSKVHPATRTFQALRITVNDELRLVEDSLPLWIDLLSPQGRLAVISFHSLEDRLVKQALQNFGGDTYDAKLTILTKNPVTAGEHEVVFNPRARSAKLRAAVKK